MAFNFSAAIPELTAASLSAAAIELRAAGIDLSPASIGLAAAPLLPRKPMHATPIDSATRQAFRRAS